MHLGERDLAFSWFRGAVGGGDELLGFAVKLLCVHAADPSCQTEGLDSRMPVGDHMFLQLNRPFLCPGDGSAAESALYCHPRRRWGLGRPSANTPVGVERGLIVLIRVSVIRAVIPRTGEGIAFVRGEIQPEIAAMAGSRGFAMAVDHLSGRYISLIAWTDDEAVKANADRVAGLMSDVARRLGGGEPSVEVFDLVLAHAVKPVRVGYWGRLTRAEIAVDDIHRAVLRFRETALPLFERYEGLAAVDLLVNWVSGVAESVVWFDSLQVLSLDPPPNVGC